MADDDSIMKRTTIAASRHPGALGGACALALQLACGFAALGGGSEAAVAAQVVLRCTTPDGSVLLTDADHCPAGSRQLGADRIEAVSTSSVRSTGSAAARPVSNKAQQRIAQAQVAACADLQSRKNDVDQQLIAGMESETSSLLVDRLQRIESDRCRLDCIPC